MNCPIFSVMRMGQDQTPRLTRGFNLFNKKSQILTYRQTVLNFKNRSLMEAIYGFMHVSRVQSEVHHIQVLSTCMMNEN